MSNWRNKNEKVKLLVFKNFLMMVGAHAPTEKKWYHSDEELPFPTHVDGKFDLRLRPRNELQRLQELRDLEVNYASKFKDEKSIQF